jgi:hypothetical protein
MKPVRYVLPFLLVVCTARSVAAQVFINPFVDTTLTSPTATGSSTKSGLGLSFGNVGRIVGVETEFAYHPDLIDTSANGVAKNRVVTISGNTLIGPTIGRVKPYGVIGAGDLYLNVTSAASVLVPNPASISNNYFTIDAGAGVMGFFTPHLGVRGDLRYFRAYGFKLTDLQSAGIALDHFDFWRASIGVAVKF